jgi:hypothetical protein
MRWSIAEQDESGCSASTFSGWENLFDINNWMFLNSRSFRTFPIEKSSSQSSASIGLTLQNICRNLPDQSFTVAEIVLFGEEARMNIKAFYWAQKNHQDEATHAVSFGQLFDAILSKNPQVLN